MVDRNITSQVHVQVEAQVEVNEPCGDLADSTSTPVPSEGAWPGGGLASWPAKAAIAVLRLYQWTLSPLLGAHCRFAPSCSQYTALAIARHGLLRGGLLGARRLGRCHPFHEGGFDPVP